MILQIPGDSIQKVGSEFTKIIDSDVGHTEKLKQLFSLMAEGYVETQSIMKERFVSLAIQNAELNTELKDQNKTLEEQLNQLQEQLEIVTQKLQDQKERERLLQEKKYQIYEKIQYFSQAEFSVLMILFLVSRIYMRVESKKLGKGIY